MAAAKHIERGYLGTLLRLTLLAPVIAEEALNGRAWHGLGLPDVLQPFPEVWEHQQELLAPR